MEKSEIEIPVVEQQYCRVYTWGDASLVGRSVSDSSPAHIPAVITSIGFEQQQQQRTVKVTKLTDSKIAVKYLDAGISHGGYITQSGQLYVWGLNTSGRLGLGHENKRKIPTLIEHTKQFTSANSSTASHILSASTIHAPSSGQFESFSCGFYHTAAIFKEKGSDQTGLFTCGRAYKGFLGHSTSTNLHYFYFVDRFKPQKGIGEEQVQAVACAKNHSLVLTTSGKSIFVWIP